MTCNWKYAPKHTQILGNLDMLKMSGKIAQFHTVSRKVADFRKRRPFHGPSHDREIAQLGSNDHHAAGGSI